MNEKIITNVKNTDNANYAESIYKNLPPDKKLAFDAILNLACSLIVGVAANNQKGA